jgi:GTP-binding protein HflX
LVSAVTGEGVEELLAAIERRLAATTSTYTVHLPPGEGAGLAWCYANSEVLSRTDEEDGSIHLTLRADPANKGILEARFAGYLQ